MDRIKKLKNNSFLGGNNVWLWIIVFAAVGTAALLLARAATPIQIDNSLPQVRNIRAYGDDRVITVAWDKPNNADNAGIVGYFVEYSETGGNTHSTKQTTDTTTQLQPVDNGKEYTIKVYAAHGSQVTVQTPGAHDDNTATEMRGSGRVSSPVTIKAVPSSARVDQLRQQMTGFFDDFNTPQGAFDELKWNQAGAACTMPGAAGAFINNQYHSHNQVSTIEVDGEYCDRGQFATRARGVFDITGRTEASPGEIVFDIDGSTHGRDVWYMDLIPLTARVSGAPVDVTAHASIFDDEVSDPMGIRLVQTDSGVRVNYFGRNLAPGEISPTFACFPDWGGLSECDATNKVPGMSPIAEMVSSARCPEWNNYCLKSVPNVRRHWRVQMTTSKIKIFIDGVRVWEGSIPSDFAAITKYQVHSTLFSYNTGKDDNTNPKTFMFHWDNFGWNGPQAPTVVHNYIEGGATGNTPYLGRGTLAERLPKGARNTIIKIPDQIGNPVKARIMFTLAACGPGWYTHNSSRGVVINGNNYPFAHPSTQVPAPVWSAWAATNQDIGNGNNPMSMSIDINPAHLIRGDNQVRLNLDGHHQCTLNVHIELEYTRGTQPSYTQPRTIFGETVMNNFITPPLESHDKYLFVEQNLDLASADDHGHPPAETCPTGTTGTPPNCTPTGTTAGPGDVNGDGKVNVFDLSTLLSNWGRTGVSRAQGDLTGDGNVGVFDLSTLLGNWTG